MNATYDNIIKHLKGTRTWKKVSEDLSKITLSKLRSKNYGIWYDDAFTGVFIDRASVNEKELKETGWKLVNRTL